MSSSHIRPNGPLLSSLRPGLRPRRTCRQPLHLAKRPASTSASQSGSRAKTILFTSAVGATGFLAYLYLTDTRASVHRWVVPRLIRVFVPDAEEGHNAAVSSLGTLYKLGLHPRERSSSSTTDPGLSITVYGTELANPVGISAGLDKHADIPDALFALGASVVEVGGCTPLPQDGNPKPRMFRIPGIDGLINRYGLNSRGADAMAVKLRDRVRQYAKSVGLTEEEVLNGGAVPPGSLQPGKLLLVQVAKNKDTDERNTDAVARDYVHCVSRLARYADVLVVNVSSPNTPGLRDLQAVEPLTKILSAVVDEAKRADRKLKPKVMVKVSPDEEEDSQIEGIVQAVWASGVDGVIVGNTTKKRTGIVPPGVKLSRREQATLTEVGGYSGPLMFERTRDLVKRYRKLLDGQSWKPEPVQATGAEASATLPAVGGAVTGLVDDTQVASFAKDSEQKVIFATGGITNGRQAVEILNAGASVAMVYTGLVYGGAGTVTRIKGEIKDAITNTKA